MPKTVYLATVVINHVLRGIVYTPPATVYIALFTSPSTPTVPGTEVSGGSYTRQTTTFGAPSSGTSVSLTDVVFPIATASWGTVVGYAVMDAPTGGNMLYFASLAAPKLIDVNDNARFPAGQLMVTEG
jgi:hypothetical protein